MIPGLGRSPGEGKDYPLQYSGLENFMDSIVSPWGPKELDMTEQSLVGHYSLSHNPTSFYQNTDFFFFFFFTNLLHLHWSISSRRTVVLSV